MWRSRGSAAGGHAAGAEGTGRAPGKRTLTQSLVGVGPRQGGRAALPTQDQGNAPGPAPGPAPAPAHPDGHRGRDHGGDHAGQPHSGGGGQGVGGRHAERIEVRCHATAAGNPAPDRTTVGVGEQVTFTAHGGGTWHATGGLPLTATGDTFEWAAPATDGHVTISVERHGQPPLTVAMDVRAPLGVGFRKLHDTPQVPAGVGMRTNLTIAPTHVSFANVEWRELGGSGAGAPQDVTGYFAAFRDQGHDLVHHPYEPWLPMGEDNRGVDDNAYSGGNPRINGTYQAGGYHWNIPNQYRVGGRDETIQTFANVPQFFEMEGAPNPGRMTVRKGGQSATQAMSGATEGDTEHFATLAEATAYLASLADRGRKPQLEQAMVMLLNLRSRDPASAGFLASAIQTANFGLYVSVTCVNAYSYVDNDAVRISVVGQRAYQAAQLNMHNADAARSRRSFTVALNSIFDWTTWSRAPITFTAVVESTMTHAMHLTSHWPYEDLGGEGQELQGSDHRYRLTAFISSDPPGAD